MLNFTASFCLIYCTFSLEILSSAIKRTDFTSLPTAYVVREEVMFSVCLSVHRGGGTQSRSGWGGVPHPAGGVPWLGVPWQGGTLAGGVPWLGGYPSGGYLGGTPVGGTPAGGYPRGGYLAPVLVTPRSVCLLHSRRRTFLLIYHLNQTLSYCTLQHVHGTESAKSGLNRFLKAQQTS